MVEGLVKMLRNLWCIVSGDADYRKGVEESSRLWEKLYADVVGRLSALEQRHALLLIEHARLRAEKDLAEAFEETVN